MQARLCRCRPHASPQPQTAAQFLPTLQIRGGGGGGGVYVRRSDATVSDAPCVRGSHIYSTDEGVRAFTHVDWSMTWSTTGYASVALAASPNDGATHHLAVRPHALEFVRTELVRATFFV